MFNPGRPAPLFTMESSDSWTTYDERVELRNVSDGSQVHIKQQNKKVYVEEHRITVYPSLNALSSTKLHPLPVATLLDPFQQQQSLSHKCTLLENLLEQQQHARNPYVLKFTQNTGTSTDFPVSRGLADFNAVAAAAAYEKPPAWENEAAKGDKKFRFDCSCAQTDAVTTDDEVQTDEIDTPKKVKKRPLFCRKKHKPPADPTSENDSSDKKEKETKKKKKKKLKFKEGHESSESTPTPDTSESQETKNHSDST